MAVHLSLALPVLASHSNVPIMRQSEALCDLNPVVKDLVTLKQVTWYATPMGGGGQGWV